MTALTQSQPMAPLSSETSYEVRGRYGNLLATAETLDMAKRDVRYRIANLGQTGVTVHEVTVSRRVVYRPRLVAVLPTQQEIAR